MAANGTSGQDGFAPILAALATMQSTAERTEKKQAHAFLEQFQKSVRHLNIVTPRRHG